MKIDSSLPPLDLINVPQRKTMEQREHDRELIQAAKAVNSSDLLGRGNELTFSLDKGSGRMVIRLVNRKTREVVEQIPAEDVLRLAEALKNPPSTRSL